MRVLYALLLFVLLAGSVSVKADDYVPHLIGSPVLPPVELTPAVPGYPGPTFEVWCPPQEDLCQLGDTKVTREALLIYLPISPVTDKCIDEFCYNTHDEVIGLNPDHGLFK